MKDVKYSILPKVKDPLFEERESGVTHTPFALELALFSAIKDGNEEALKNSITNYINNGFVIGNMANMNESNIKYWAIATISTATHYAILGGLDETDAYNMSDRYLQEVSSIKDFNVCFTYLENKSLELVRAVHKAKETKKVSKKIAQCIHYIHIHLHEKLTIELLADEVSLSRDYLSILFKKEVGIPLHEYILNKRIEASIEMMKQNKTYQEIAYTLNFCSQTHFINAFKKKMGMTPKEYKKTL